MHKFECTSHTQTEINFENANLNLAKEAKTENTATFELFDDNRPIYVTADIMYNVQYTLHVLYIMAQRIYSKSFSDWSSEM